jgi:glutathione peroxidase
MEAARLPSIFVSFNIRLLDYPTGGTVVKIIACVLTTFIAVVLPNFVSALQVETAPAENAPDEKEDVPAALNFKIKSLDGEEVDLSKYLGHVVLVVNVASQCGLTPQYEQLQELHEKYAGKGLAVLGFPCNQFGNQEPGNAAEIKEFCQKNYGVKFDLFSKIDVNGNSQCELYKYLTSLDLKPKGQGDVQWNFEKFVIDRNGKPIARFGPRTTPDDPDLLKVIKAALDPQP